MSESTSQNTLMLSLYSALCGASFVALLALPQLSPYLDPAWMYPFLLALYATSTLTMAVFAVVHYIVFERPETPGIDTYIERLESDHAVQITRWGVGIFAFSFYALVFALSTFAFLVAVLSSVVLLICLRRFFKSSSHSFMNDD